MKKQINKKKAFTLIEVLVVSTIIGVLVTVTAVSFSSSQKRSRDARRKADLETMRQALVLYKQDNGSYGDVSGGFQAVVQELYSDGYLTSSSITDPKSNDPTYDYILSCVSGVSTDCDQVLLTADLESDSDPYATYDLKTP